jgi:hypothetical protein
MLSNRTERRRPLDIFRNRLMRIHHRPVTKAPDASQHLRYRNNFYVLSRIMIFQENVTGNVFLKNQGFNVHYY